LFINVFISERKLAKASGSVKQCAGNAPEIPALGLGWVRLPEIILGDRYKRFNPSRECESGVALRFPPQSMTRVGSR
jgi:hypothetical protein